MDAAFSQKEKELVALGASIAAGCIPCTRYHVKAVQAERATTEEISRALDVALRVKDSTKGIMRHVAQEALGLSAGHQLACCANPPDRLTELVSIAAAVAVNCPTSFRRHVETGRTVGVRDDEIQVVIDFARMIRARATAKMDQTTDEFSSAPAPARTTSCCGPSPCQ